MVLSCPDGRFNTISLEPFAGPVFACVFYALFGLESILFSFAGFLSFYNTFFLILLFSPFARIVGELKPKLKSETVGAGLSFPP